MKKKKQQGFSMVSASLALGLLSYAALQLYPLVGQYQQYTFRIATVSGINELAQAAKTYYADPVNASSWPATPTVLETNNYLAGFSDRNGYGFPYVFTVVGSTLQISTAAIGVPQAVNVASHFGGLASVTGDTVTVTWSAPGNDANHNQLLPRDGSRDVFGTITHRSGSGADIVMNGNDITTVDAIGSTGSVTIRNGSSTGLISADTGAIDVLTVQDIRIIP